MRRWWEELVIDFFDRMDAIVGLTHKGRLNHQEHELAVQMALVRFSEKLVHTFAGTSMGELVNATKTLATFACIDVQRESVRDRARLRSIDGGWKDDEDDRRSEAWEAGESRARFERDERSDDVTELLDWALPQIRESRRAVLELTFHGATIPEICEELGLSQDNAYQLRSRGFKDLAILKERYES